MTDNQSDQDTCPQCRSTKTVSLGILQGQNCEYCGHQWANINGIDVDEAISIGDEIRLPDKLSNPITVREIDGRRMKLDGNGGATYKLTITPDATGLLRRKKGSSEQNQFGSRWTNTTEVDYELVGSSKQKADTST